MRSLAPLVTLFTALCVAGGSLSQPGSTDGEAERAADSSHVQTMEEMFVTVTQLPTPLLQAPGNISVITANEIEASAAQHIGDILKYYCGAHIGEYGMLGQPVSVGLRGAADRQVLVAVDGRSVNDPQFGGYDLTLLSLEMIERVEVIKGCTFPHCGSGATGGVIHIVTKRKPSARPYTRVRYESGEVGLRRTAIHFGQDFKNRLLATVTYDERSTDGFRENDDYDGQNMTGVLEYSLSPQWNVTSALRHYRGDGGVPGAESLPRAGWRRKARWTDVDATLQRKGDEGTFESRVYFTDIQSEGSDTSLYSHTNRVCGAHVEGFFRIGVGGRALLGSNIQRNAIESSVVGKHHSHEVALYGATELRPHRRVSFRPWVRYDGHSKYDPHISPGLTCGVALSKAGLVHLSLQTGYRTPSLNDIFFPSRDPPVRPEKSRCLDLSFSRREQFWEVLSSLFVSDVTDRIMWRENGGVERPSNIDVRNTGLELAVKWSTLKHISFGSTFQYVHAEDKATGKLLPYCPKTSAAVWLQFATSFLKDQIEFTLRGEAEHLGEQYTDYDETSRMKEYGLLHAKATCRIQDFNFYVVFRNLTDKRYRTRAGYPMPGRIMTLGGAWEFWD